MPATVKEVLAKALVILDRDGWCQGTATNEKGQHCMIGLVGQANKEMNNDVLSQGAPDVIRMVIGSRVIADWNDAPVRTIDDVRAVLARAMESA